MSSEGEKSQQAEAGEKCRRWIILIRDRLDGRGEGTSSVSVGTPMPLEFSTCRDYQAALYLLEDSLASESDDFVEFETEAKANEWFRGRTGKHPAECLGDDDFHPEIGGDR